MHFHNCRLFYSAQFITLAGAIDADGFDDYLSEIE